MNVRHSARSLVNRPWYAAAIVVVLAVGFSLLTTVLAVVDGVLFKPLGYPLELQLVEIDPFSTGARSTPGLERDDLTAWAEAIPEVAFTGMFVYGAGTGIAAVQPNFFEVVGVMPALGGFAPEDFERSASSIEPRIVTDEVFQSQFGGDLGAIGRVVMLDPAAGYGYRVVGVMPPGFIFPSDRLRVGFLTTHVIGRFPLYGLRRVIARMSRPVPAVELQDRLMAAAAVTNAARESAGQPSIDRFAVTPLRRALGANSRPLFAALLVAAGVLLVVAAVNASSLLAARSVDRSNELIIRRALGATSFAIARLVMAEVALLVAAGATVGLLAALPFLQLASVLLPPDLVLFRTAAVDWRVGAFTLATAAALGILVALWPLRVVGHAGVTPATGRIIIGPNRHRNWRFTVTVQVALALVLTVVGSLLVGSLLSVYARTQPIATTNVVAVAVQFFGASYARTDVRSPLAYETTRRIQALVDRVRTVPGVDAAAVTAYDLLEGYTSSWLTPPPSALDKRQAVMMHAVTADFYRIVIPELVSGRYPSDSEAADDLPLVVVSERVASNYWPDGSAIGQRLTAEGPGGVRAGPFTVVGVVRDVRWTAWDQEARPTIYGPHALLARQAYSYLLVRVSGDAAATTAEVRRVLAQTDPMLDVRRSALLDDLFVDSVRPRRFRAWLFGSFAVASLCILGLGVVGQLTMSTARRTREVGIRMACGATRHSIGILMFREQALPVMLGIVVGAVGAYLSVPIVSSYLYHGTAFDVRSWAAAIGMVLLSAAAGILVPALKASRLDPNESLRIE